MSVSGRAAARAIWEAALAAGNVDPIVRRVLRRDGDVITAGPLAVDLKTVRRLLVLGAGKASAAMAQAVEDLLDDRISDGLVVVKDGYARATRTVRIVEAPLSTVLAVFNDIDRATEWMDSCNRSSVVQDLGDRQKIVYNRTHASWPVSGIRSTPSVHSGSFVLSLPLIQRYCMRGSMLCSRPSMFQGPPPVE